MTLPSEDEALLILNALAPLSRKGDWWMTGGPIAVVAGELRRLFPERYAEPSCGCKSAWVTGDKMQVTVCAEHMEELASR